MTYKPLEGPGWDTPLDEQEPVEQDPDWEFEPC